MNESIQFSHAAFDILASDADAFCPHALLDHVEEYYNACIEYKRSGRKDDYLREEMHEKWNKIKNILSEWGYSLVN